MNLIHYSKGFKYQLRKDYITKIDIYPDEAIGTEFITLLETGVLVINSGYAWDGPSGPTIDTKNFMRGALVHDVLYQLIRMGLLAKENREKADLLLKQICLEDGMSRLRAWYVYRGVKRFAAFATAARNIKKIYIAGKE